MIYTVHVPRDAYDPVAAAERARFVKDGFSWGAFVFGPVWLLWQRSIIGFVAYLALAAALFGLQRAMGLSPASLPLLLGLLALFIGFEGPALVRWSIDRRRFRCVDVVSAVTREEAEHQFLRRWMQRSAAARPGATPPGAAGYSTFGLFSDEAG
jgi:hypothetical protein